MASRIYSTENVFLFIPNLIGYARIIFALVSFYYMPTNYLVAMTFYASSALMDALDGYAARHFNQSTKFGAILDQLTDRVGTMCLIMVLGEFYPNYMFLFQLSNLIDIAGHWVYVWFSLLKGRTSHKLVNPKENFILQVYYSSKAVLFTMCAANELFYISLYLLHFTSGPRVIFTNQGLFLILSKLLLPLAIIKCFITVVQMVDAFIGITTIDMAEREAIMSKEISRESQKLTDSPTVDKSLNKPVLRRRFLPKRRDIVSESDNSVLETRIMKIQDDTAEDLIDFTKNLKELCVRSGEVIKKDIELIETTTSVADTLYSNLKKSSDRLGDLVKRSCQFWVWIMLVVTFVSFFNMIMFIKFYRKPIYIVLPD